MFIELPLAFMSSCVEPLCHASSHAYRTLFVPNITNTASPFPRFLGVPSGSTSPVSSGVCTGSARPLTKCRVTHCPAELLVLTAGVGQTLGRPAGTGAAAPRLLGSTRSARHGGHGRHRVQERGVRGRRASVACLRFARVLVVSRAVGGPTWVLHLLGAECDCCLFCAKVQMDSCYVLFKFK